MGHQLGYARVSTPDQDLALQEDALRAAGCYRIFSDKASGKLTDRPQLTIVLDQLRPGDTLVVWRLDRLGRSMRHLVETLTDLTDREVGFRSLTEALDTTTPTGRLITHVFGAFAEFERDLIRDRTMAGLAAARARGRKGGRPAKLNDIQISLAREMYAEKKHTMAQIAETFRVAPATIYRHLDPKKAP
jgi:DNA invertase Pin-like site-specific DNA recombinase